MQTGGKERKRDEAKKWKRISFACRGPGKRPSGGLRLGRLFYCGLYIYWFGFRAASLSTFSGF